MFRNLYSLPRFTDHNFNDSTGILHQEQGPGPHVGEAFRIRRPYRPHPYLLSTLSCTLSPLCCASFLRANPALPITERDYYLSKLFQFLRVACMDELADPSDYGPAADDLAKVLDEALPDGSHHFANLWLLHWQKLFDDYVHYDVISLAEKIAAYLPAPRDSRMPAPRAADAVMETPAKVIDRLRKKQGWTLQRLAEVAGLDPKQVYKVKRGATVTTNTITTLALTLGCPPGDLI